MKKILKKFKKMSKKKKAVLFVALLLIIGGVAFFTLSPDKKDPIIKKIKKLTEEEPKITIFDVNSTKRPVAVMINNHNQARPYHSGLQDAQIVYEMIVEGGITRMLAVFKDQTTSRIGPVRSSRHYYLD